MKYYKHLDEQYCPSCDLILEAHKFEDKQGVLRGVCQLCREDKLNHWKSGLILIFVIFILICLSSIPMLWR